VIYFCNLETNKVEWAANDVGNFITKKPKGPQAGQIPDEVLFFNDEGI